MLEEVLLIPLHLRKGEGVKLEGRKLLLHLTTFLTLLWLLLRDVEVCHQLGIGEGMQVTLITRRNFFKQSELLTL